MDTLLSENSAPYPVPQEDYSSALNQIEDEEMDLLARIEKLEQNINESASKLQRKENCKKDEGLAQIEEQEEIDGEIGQSLSIHQEKLSPLHGIPESQIDEMRVFQPGVEPIENGEMVFVEFYPGPNSNSPKDKELDGNDKGDIEVINREEKMKKSGGQVQKDQSPKAEQLGTITEVKEINEEENNRYRYSKMDERQAEVLYQERFNQLLNKFQQTTVQREKSQDRKKAPKMRPVLERTKPKESVPKGTSDNFVQKKGVQQRNEQISPVYGSQKKDFRQRKEQISPKYESQKKDFPQENPYQTAKFGMIENTGMTAKSFDLENRGVQKAYLLHDQGVEKKRMREQIAREAAERKELEQFNNCTFSPALSLKARNLNNYENILEKTKKFHQKLAEKIRNHENERKEKEMENCTFSPQINSRRSVSIPKSSSCDDFYRNQINWKKKITAKNIHKANIPFSSSKKNLRKDESFISRSQKQNTSMSKLVSPESTRSETGYNFPLFTRKKPETPTKKYNNVMGGVNKVNNTSAFIKKSTRRNGFHSNQQENYSKPEKLCQEINDTMLIFNNIREHLLSSQKKRPSRTKKSPQTTKNTTEKSFVFRTIPCEDKSLRVNSSKLRSSSQRPIKSQKEPPAPAVKKPTQIGRKIKTLDDRFAAIFDKANSITSYIKKLL